MTARLNLAPRQHWYLTPCNCNIIKLIRETIYLKYFVSGLERSYLPVDMTVGGVITLVTRGKNPWGGRTWNCPPLVGRMTGSCRSGSGATVTPTRGRDSTEPGPGADPGTGTYPGAVPGTTAEKVTEAVPESSTDPEAFPGPTVDKVTEAVPGPVADITDATEVLISRSETSRTPETAG